VGNWSVSFRFQSREGLFRLPNRLACLRQRGIHNGHLHNPLDKCTPDDYIYKEIKRWQKWELTRFNSTVIISKDKGTHSFVLSMITLRQAPPFTQNPWWFTLVGVLQNVAAICWQLWPIWIWLESIVEQSHV
jgi:hypothetical protein